MLIPNPEIRERNWEEGKGGRTFPEPFAWRPSSREHSQISFPKWEIFPSICIFLFCTDRLVIVAKAMSTMSFGYLEQRCTNTEANVNKWTNNPVMGPLTENLPSFFGIFPTCVGTNCLHKLLHHISEPHNVVKHKMKIDIKVVYFRS